MRLLWCLLIFYFLNDAVLGKTVLNTDDVKNDIGNLDIVHYQPEQVHLAFGGKFLKFVKELHLFLVSNCD